MNRYTIRAARGGIAVVLLAGLVTVAQADTIPCPLCSDADLRESAASRGPGQHHVANIPGNVLKHFLVECPSGPNPNAVDPKPEESTDPSDAKESGPGYVMDSYCGGNVRVTELSVTQSVADGFAIVRRIWLDTSGSFSKSVEVQYSNTNFYYHGGPTGGPNGYTAAGDANFRGQLGSHIGQNGAYVSGVFSYLAGVGDYVGAMINAFAGQSDGLRIEITVTFSDGSTSKFRWTYGESDASYIEGSSRTPGGQVIPEDVGPGGAGQWSESGPLGGDDLEQFVNFLQMRGIRITRASGSRIRSVSCVWEGTQLHCTTT